MAAFSSISKKQLAIWVLLLILPLLHLVGFRIAMVQQGSYFWRINADPSLPYLFNSLNIVSGIPPWHIHHPGTPLQLLGAVVLQLNQILDSWRSPTPQPIIEAVLTNPEHYLSQINLLLIVINAGIIAVLGWVAFRVSQRLEIALILQTTSFLIARVFLARPGSRVAPELLLFGIGQLIVLLLIFYLYQEGIGRKAWFAASLGILLGVGMASKVTMLPAILFIFLVEGARRKALAVGTAIATFVLCTLPIIDAYPRMAQWFLRLMSRTGTYGGGDVGIFNFNLWGINLATLMERATLFFLVMGTATLIILGSAVRYLWQSSQSGLGLKFFPLSKPKNSQSIKAFLLLFLIVAITWIQVLLIINEQVSLRYLMFPLALTGLLIVLLHHLLVSPFRLPWTELLLLVACLVISGQQWATAYQASFEQTQIVQKDVVEIQQFLQNPIYQNCTRVFSSASDAPESALWWSNYWAGNSFSSKLQQLYPQAIFMQPPFSYQYVSFQHPLSSAEVEQKPPGCIILQTKSVGRGDLELARGEAVGSLSREARSQLSQDLTFAALNKEPHRNLKLLYAGPSQGTGRSEMLFYFERPAS